MCQTLQGLDGVDGLSSERIWFNIGGLQSQFKLTRLQALEVQAQYQELLAKNSSPTDTEFHQILGNVKNGRTLSQADEHRIEKSKGLIGVDLTSFVLNLKQVRDEGDFVPGLHQQIIEFKGQAYAVGLNPGFIFLMRQLLPLGYGFTVYSDLSSQDLRDLLQKIRLGESQLSDVFLAQFSKSFQVGRRNSALNTSLYLESQVFQNRDTFIVHGLKPTVLYHPDEGMAVAPFQFQTAEQKSGLVSQLSRLNPFNKNTLNKFLETQKTQGQSLSLQLSHGLLIMKELNIPLSDALRPYSHAGSEVLKMLGTQKKGENQARLNLLLSMMPYAEFIKLAQNAKGLESITDWSSP